MSLKFELDFRKIFNSLKLKNLFSKLNFSHLFYTAILVHLSVMPFPMDGFVFDEVHYIKAARETLLGHAANAEHPPLAKFLYAGSIGIFGDWWLSWRIVPLVCAVIALPIFYLIARKFMTPRKAMLVSAFLLFDTLFFVNTSIAILDGPAILFALIGVERFLSKKWKTSGAMFAVGVLMKETALFIMIPVLLWFGIQKVRKSSILKKANWKTLGTFALMFLVVVFGVLQAYDTVYKPSTGTTVQVAVQANVIVDGETHLPISTTTTTVTNTISSPIENPIGHIQFMVAYFSGLVPSINAQGLDYRPPWGWILPAEGTFNPPPYLVVVTKVGDVSRTAINWVSQVSPAIAFMYIPIVAVALWLVIKKHDLQLPLFVLSWSLVAYVPWLVLGSFVQRMTFNYYFIYTIPALCLGIPMFWDAMPINRNAKHIALAVQFAIVLVTFALTYPVVLPH